MNEKEAKHMVKELSLCCIFQGYVFPYEFIEYNVLTILEKEAKENE